MAKRASSKTAGARKPDAKPRRGGDAPAPPPVPAPARPARSGARRARVRMYRHGLGDCFLISLKRNAENAPDYRIMIDCGVILGTPDPKPLMTNVVEDIVKETGGKIDLLIVTHEHWDHLSGFIQAADSFKKLTPEHVWVAWTEDPADPLAKELGKERALALTTLQRGVQALAAAGDDEQAQTVSDLLGFFGAAADGTTKAAFDSVKKMAPLRFCRPSDPPVHLADPDARLYILGPPHDAKLIRRTLPSKSNPETYGLAMDGSGAMAADVHAALTGGDASQPFGDLHAIPLDVAKGIDFFRERYWGPGADAPAWRSISSDWLDSAADLALALDSATNNTSLVLAIELVGGDVLLFVADAQVGNWESWQNLSWTVDGRSVTGPDLLRRTIFYKVGHHGSHNATLSTLGLEQMANLEMAAIPVNHEMALKKRWGQMPLPKLVEALTKKTNGKVLRSDDNPSLVIDGVRSDNKLYYEMTF
jgi:hypothetical protein